MLHETVRLVHVVYASDHEKNNLLTFCLQELLHDGAPTSRTAVSKARLAAAFVGLELPVRVADGLDVSPVLHDNVLGGPLSRGNAIARHFADHKHAARRLCPCAPFDGASRQLAAEVDAWMDFSALLVRLPLPLLVQRTTQAVFCILALMCAQYCGSKASQALQGICRVVAHVLTNQQWDRRELQARW